MADAPTTVAARPQPIGTFPLPLGYLLIPAGAEEARTEMLAGRLPDRWSPALRGHQLAAEGRRDEAIAELIAQDTPAARYNRFVLDPDSEDPTELRSVLGEFAVLVDLVLFTLGRADTPPELGGADGELAAAVLSAQASHALADGDPGTAIGLLDRAVEAVEPLSAPLAGMLLGQGAAICRDVGDASCAPRLERALRALDDADDLRLARAELHLCLAGVLHEQAVEHPDLMVKAIPHYHSTLQLVTAVQAPLVWAGAHAGLGAAYLTMPMAEASGQLRLGVAGQSLRAALTIYTRDEYPEQWASAQLNLANSLVYTPSRHQADNLVEAVELYQAVLETRDRDSDPLGRARVLANQGNVLAHLGIFDNAKAKLYEARYLFEELGDNESVRTVRGVLDEIARQTTLAKSDGDGRVS